MLPKGWQRIRLEDIADVRTGLAKGKTGLKDPVELPYLRVANVQDGHLNLAEIKTILVERDQIDRYRLRRGDVLMTEGGDFDKLGRGDVWREQIPLCLHQNHVFVVRPDQDRLDPGFLAAMAASEHGRNYFLSCAKRSTNLASINATQLNAFPVLLPSLEEQREIAAALAVWDAAIATTECLLANSQTQKRSLMQALLSPQHGGVDWKTHRLGLLFRERVEPQRDDLPLLSITREDGVIPRTDVGRKDTSNEDKSKYLRICPGDIGYNTMRMWQGVSALSSLEGIVSPAYTIVTPNEKIDGRYAAYLFKLPSMVFTFYRHSQGLVSDTWSLKFDHFKKISVSIPNRKEQERIVRILSAADEVITSLSAQIEHLRTEKSALMQQLLTGKRRMRLSATAEAAFA